MTRGPLAGFFVLALTAGSASADVTDFIGTWTNSAPSEAGFLNGLMRGSAPSDQIARIVVTPAGVNAVRLHFYGRCTPECDWGSAIGRNHSASPESDAVDAVISEFSTGTASKHITLRKGPGRILQFEVVTDFNDRSGRHDYIASGSLRPAPTAPVAAPPVVAAAEPAVSPLVPAQAPAPAAAPADFVEDCERINPEDVYLAPADRGWRVNDFNHTILNFDSDKLAAAKALRVMQYYRFDEQCYIRRPKPKMIYWRVSGQIPNTPMPGEDCMELHPAALSQRGGQVVDGDRVVLDYENDTAGATMALGVLKTFRITRQCFAARPNLKMIYWLAK